MRIIHAPPPINFGLIFCSLVQSVFVTELKRSAIYAQVLSERR